MSDRKPPSAASRMRATRQAADVQRWREDTPGVADHIHLNNAGSSLMPSPVVEALAEHFALEAVRGGYQAASERAEALSSAYDAVAQLLGTQPRNVAFVQSATIGFMQALSSIPFRRDSVILTTRNDYVSNQTQFLSLKRRFGCKVVRAPDRPQGGVDGEAIAGLIESHRPALVCVTHVPTNSGLVQDIATIGAMCRDAGVPYLVDACQSVGQMPLDVERIGCDFLSVTCRKFLRGPRGIGFLYVSDRVLDQGMEPLFIDLRGAAWTAADEYTAVDDARRFETWESSPALVLGASQAVRYALGVGLDAIERRVIALADRLRRALSAIRAVRVLDRGDALCAIVSISVANRDHRDLVSRMGLRGIQIGVQPREVALLDNDDKGIGSSIRLSPHYFNTEEEVDRCADVLAELVGRHAT